MADQATSTEQTSQSALSLANTFSACVECFGLIHGHPKWVAAEHLELTRLGIEQGRLLAWADAVGLCEPATGDARDPRLDEADRRDTVDAALKAIIDRPQYTDRATQFEKYGLKPPKRSQVTFEPTFDFNRLEAFREKLYHMRERERRGSTWGRGKSATYSHWQIVDTRKFAAFVGVIRDSVNLLIDLFGVGERVDMALRHDIRAMGWHPVFEKSRASKDLSKLKMTREACATAYPSYAEAADTALAQLDKEWKDHYQAIMEQRPTSTEIPMAASRQMAAARRQSQQKENGGGGGGGGGERRSSLFDIFRPKHKRKHSKQDASNGGPNKSATNGLAVPADDMVPRSKSMSHANDDDDDDDAATQQPRSKSISVFPSEGGQSLPHRLAGDVVEEQEEKEDEQEGFDPISRIETSKDLATVDLEPVSSMVSRQDQAYLYMHRQSIA